MYDQVEAIAKRLGIKPTHHPRLSPVWYCWADRVLEADMQDHAMMRQGDASERARFFNRRDDMIRDANMYA